MLITKQCTTCKQIHPVSMFYRHKLHKTGYKSQCKQCTREIDKIRMRNNYINNKESYIKQALNRYYKDKPHHQKLARISRKNRMNSNPSFKIRINMSNRISQAVRNNFTTKSSKTLDLIGCTALELKTYLESKFITGMSWDNYGKWHVDHIIPCSVFELTDPVEQKQCFHYTNLQPLWAKDNLKKSDNVI